MEFVSKTLLTCMSFLLCLGLAACVSSKKKSSRDNPQTPTPVAPVSGDGDASKGDVSQKTPPSGKVDDNKDRVSTLTPIAIGQEVSATGDVLKDENGLFSLMKAFSFKLEKETALQVRKTFNSGNCGVPSAAFIVMKGEDQVANASIDKDRQYDGIPIVKFESPLGAGDYTLVSFITLDQECKNMKFHYDFFLEAVK